MYSQFSFAQQTGTAQGVVQQAGVTWNGREWVPSNPPLSPPPPNIQLPPCPPHLQMPDMLRTPVATLVAHFSLAYQYFVEQANIKTLEADAVGTSSAEKEEAKRQAAWHKYHADLSARYAHHYNNFQNTPPITQSTAPTPNANSISASISSPNSIQSAKLKTEVTSNASIALVTEKDNSKSSSSSAAVPPASFQRFAHRCLSKCENDIQRSSMEKQIASTIETAIKEGYMHTKNWDTEAELSIKLDFKAFLGKKMSSEKSSLHVIPKPTAKASYLAEDLPESFHRFAQRCLAQCENDIQRVSMEQQLLKRIEQAKSEGYINTRNWDDEPELNIKLDIKAFLARKILSRSSSAKVDGESSQGIKHKPSVSRTLMSNGVPMKNPISTEADEESTKRFKMEPAVSRSLSSNGVPLKNPIISSNAVRDEFLSEIKYGTTDWIGSKSLSNEVEQMNDESKKARAELKRKRVYDSSFDKEPNDDNDPVDSYYGPVLTTLEDLPLNDSYYGPSSGDDLTYAKTAASNSRIQMNVHNEGPLRNESYYGNNAIRPVFPPSVSKSNISDDKAKTSSKMISRPHSLPGKISSFGEGSKCDSFTDDRFVGDFIPLASKAKTTKTDFASYSLSRKTSSVDEKVLPDNSLEKLNHRANRFSGKGGLSEAVSSDLHSEYLIDTDKYMGKSFIGGSKGPSKKAKLDEQDYEKMTVKGTCETLEKDFLRLTAPPRADLVRPQAVLEIHLKNLKKRWYGRNNEAKSSIKNVTNNNKGNDGSKDYAWFCSQLKAVRQDLTVQRITNEFTVDCYETHARIALEEGDLNEYNQCQTKLKEVYEILRHKSTAQSNSSSTAILPKGLQNESEFIAYRIIYYCFLTGNKKYDGGSSDLMKILKSLTAEQRSNPTISHAINVREAVTSDDYHSFFCLQGSCPNKGIFLMESIAPQMRTIGLQRIVKAYRPSVSMDFVCKELALGSREEGRKWLESCGCKFADDYSCILTKDSELKESDLCSKRVSSLI